jgi:hypothetical protein
MLYTEAHQRADEGNPGVETATRGRLRTFVPTVGETTGVKGKHDAAKIATRLLADNRVARSSP